MKNIEGLLIAQLRIVSANSSVQLSDFMLMNVWESYENGWLSSPLYGSLLSCVVVV